MNTDKRLEWRPGERYFGMVSACLRGSIAPGDIVGVWTHRSKSDDNTTARLPGGLDGYRSRTPCPMRVLCRRFSQGRSWLRLICVPFGQNGRWADGTVCEVYGESLACAGYGDRSVLTAAEADMDRFRSAFVRRVAMGKLRELGQPHGGNTDLVRAIVAIGGLPPGADGFPVSGGPDNIDGREELGTLFAAVRAAEELESQWAMPAREIA